MAGVGTQLGQKALIRGGKIPLVVFSTETGNSQELGEFTTLICSFRHRFCLFLAKSGVSSVLLQIFAQNKAKSVLLLILCV